MTKKNLLAGAVDIGGTKVSVGLVNSSGEVMTKISFSTPVAEGPRFCADAIVAALNDQLTERSLRFHDLEGIGIGCAGPVDVERGTIENPYTLPGFESYPLTAEISKRTGLTAVIENDVNTSLLGEVFLYDLKERHVLMITFGTGIGVAAYKNGDLYTTRKSSHPEMGHVLVDRYGPSCYCGNRGCFESLCSGTALNRRAYEEGYGDFSHLFEAYHEGDFKAVDLMTTMFYQLKAGLWNLMTVFRPEIVILGGGVMKQYFEFFKGALQKLLPESWDFIDHYTLQAAQTQNDSALVGAANLILRETKFYE